MLKPPHWINAVLGIEPEPCVYWASTLSSELHLQPQTKESLVLKIKKKKLPCAMYGLKTVSFNSNVEDKWPV